MRITTSVRAGQAERQGSQPQAQQATVAPAFVDARADAVAMRKRREMIANSPHATSLQAKFALTTNAGQTIAQRVVAANGQQRNNAGSTLQFSTNVLQRRAETRMLYDSFCRICLNEGYVAGATYLLENGDTTYTENNLVTARLLMKEFPVCAKFADSNNGSGSFLGNVCSALYKLDPGNEQPGEEFAPEEQNEDVVEEEVDFDNTDHGDEGGNFEDLSSDDQGQVDSAEGYGMIERYLNTGKQIQLQAASNKVGDKKKHGKYTVSYKTTGAGSINFNSPHTLSPQSGFSSWIHKTGSTVNILNGKHINYVAQGGKVYKWSEKKNDRGLHFAAANYIYNGTKARRSPDGWTWHHLENPVGGMVLVRREVHSRHHHNGGVFLWNP